MQKKLSIGTAVYNLDEPFLREHIEGIQKQLTDETELLLIDDCSTNNSGEICCEYASGDSRIRYIKMDENGGLSRVRNRTIEEAQGKWIFFADGDDLLSDYFVENALAFCHTDEDIIILERLKFTEQKPSEQPYKVSELTHLPEYAGKRLSISCLCLDPNLAYELELPSRAFFHAAWGALYRKEFLLNNNLRFPDGQKKAQDSVFNTGAYYCAKRIAYLPHIMYFYRNNPSGITNRYTADLPDIFRSLLQHLEKCKQDFYAADADVEKRYMNHRVMATVIDNMRLNIFHKNNPKDYAQRKKEFLEFVNEEPYKTALETFSAIESGRPEWHLLAVLIRKKRFGILNTFVGNTVGLRIVCGIDKRVEQLIG